MEANHRAVFRADALFGLLLGVLVVGALRGVLVVVAQALAPWYEIVTE